MRRLLEEAFRPEDVTVETYGNVHTATAFLYGLTVKDLKRSALEVRDPNYQLVIAAKAVKARRNDEIDAKTASPSAN
jgi:hypothetical protein